MASDKDNLSVHVMASVKKSGSGRKPRRLDLPARMSRVLRQLRHVRKSADADAVHDLRVAIRRCRSVAAIMQEVDAHVTWREMKKLPRKLFRAAGTLRDLQVLAEWLKRLTTANDPMQSQLLVVLEDRQVKPLKHVLRAARRFDQAAWTRLARTLAPRARLVPPGSRTAQCLALERFVELDGLHDRAVHTEAPQPWHALRVGLKRFRYVVESLLPGQSAIWDDSLGQLQGWLGTIHDLDVFGTWITREAGAVARDSLESLRYTIAARRKSCLERYREHTSGTAGLLQLWRAGLPHETAVAAATEARLRTMARAMDPHPRRTVGICRLALQIFDRLNSSGAASRFRDDRLRVILRTAARLHAIRQGDGDRARHKRARDIVRAVPLPLGWKRQEWQLVAEIVRYHRGAEPAARQAGFGRLSREAQDRVRGLAGVLRLARELYRCGARTAPTFRADGTAVHVRIAVANLNDTKKTAARLAGAKHLLEGYLRRPILIELAT